VEGTLDALVLASVRLVFQIQKSESGAVSRIPSCITLSEIALREQRSSVIRYCELLRNHEYHSWWTVVFSIGFHNRGQKNEHS